MEIYLLRHAIAVMEKYPNDDRPLSKEGIEKMERAAKGMKNIINGIDVLLSSPLMRANATASIVAQAINYNKKILITPFLLPDAAPKLLIAFLSKYKTKKSIMLVGHEPHMSKTASALLGSQTTIFEMKKGALCRIDIPEPSQTKTGTLIFHCPPKILRELA